MAPKRRTRVLPLVAAGAAALASLQLPAFLVPQTAPATPSGSAAAGRSDVGRLQRLSKLARLAGTGLVWPSPEAEAKVRTEGSVTLYPTHNWQDDMSAVVDAKAKLDNAPVLVGVAADSGCGKSTFLRRIIGALGTEVKPGHTAIGDMMTVICLDDYHINDRAGRKVTGLTALDVKENDFDLMNAQMAALKKGQAIYKPIYNHDTGFKDHPELIEPNKVVVIEGLHPLMNEGVRNSLDLGVYIDIVDEVKFAWKVQRDVAERGWTEDQVRADIEKRKPDFAAYVDVQKADADVILRYEPSEKGLPYLKVKLIQKKSSKFPAVTLTKELNLPGEPGAVLKTYDDEWYGHAVSVIEMDGEVDAAKFDEQAMEIQSAITGLKVNTADEFSEAMKTMKAAPGSANGTGFFQTVIALKVREVYEKLTR
eukprot:TRINITY_DN523_c0_g1_i1.p1 TRINITY_DN523_c0_g1~~TRINITY_DN523_c0_g1_i1.p1  ORF type:complete len:423 (-),score=133.17 TRINITY_DN523_c0_g1_i1:66-1334(-)